MPPTKESVETSQICGLLEFTSLCFANQTLVFLVPFLTGALAGFCLLILKTLLLPEMSLLLFCVRTQARLCKKEILFLLKPS